MKDAKKVRETLLEKFIYNKEDGTFLSRYFYNTPVGSKRQGGETLLVNFDLDRRGRALKLFNAIILMEDGYLPKYQQENVQYVGPFRFLDVPIRRVMNWSIRQ